MAEQEQFNVAVAKDPVTRRYSPTESFKKLMDRLGDNAGNIPLAGAAFGRPSQIFIDATLDVIGQIQDEGKALNSAGLTSCYNEYASQALNMGALTKYEDCVKASATTR